MLSNIIFHLVFALFAIWAGAAWFIQQKRLKNTQALLRILCIDSFELPKQRSTLLRGLKILEHELELFLQVKVRVGFPGHQKMDVCKNPLPSLCAFLKATELKAQVVSSKKLVSVIFSYSLEECSWAIELI